MWQFGSYYKLVVRYVYISNGKITIVGEATENISFKGCEHYVANPWVPGEQLWVMGDMQRELRTQQLEHRTQYAAGLFKGYKEMYRNPCLELNCLLLELSPSIEQG